VTGWLPLLALGTGPFPNAVVPFENWDWSLLIFGTVLFCIDRNEQSNAHAKRLLMATD
jgi:hypothetical protein